MNFGDDPFNRFSTFNPQSRLAQFRKRFTDFSNDNNNRSNMFFDTNRHEWPNSRWRHVYDMATGAPNVNQHSKHIATNGEEEGIPIKVIHETSSDNVCNEDSTEASADAKSASGDNDCSQSGSTSASGSHSNHSNHSGSVFHQNESRGSSSPSNSRAFEAKVNPRVRHIPIMVEPRDGSTSSGYTSDNVVNDATPNTCHEKPVSRSSSRSSHNSHSSVARSPSPTKSVSSHQSNASNASKASNASSHSSNSSAKSRIRQIPIVVENNAVKTANMTEKPEPKVKPNVSAQSRAKTAKTTSKSGPYVTRIPVVNESEAKSEQQNTQTPIKHDDSSHSMISIQIINEILIELKNLEEKVKAFKGNSRDKNYRYLDEMLTRCMIELDNIDTEGRDDIRKHRKDAIMAVHNCLALLDSKITSNESKTEVNNTCEQMECTDSDHSLSHTTDSNNKVKSGNEESAQPKVESNAINETNEKMDSNADTNVVNVTNVNVCPQQNNTINETNDENGCKQTIMVTSL